jgi:hypothetical protein
MTVGSLNLRRVFWVSLADLCFEVAAVALARCGSELLTKLRSFLVALAAALDLAFTFSHRPSFLLAQVRLHRG